MLLENTADMSHAMNSHPSEQPNVTDLCTQTVSLCCKRVGGTVAVSQ